MWPEKEHKTKLKLRIEGKLSLETKEFCQMNEMEFFKDIKPVDIKPRR